MLLLLLSEGRPKANSVMQTDFNNNRVFQGGSELKYYCFQILQWDGLWHCGLEFSNVSNNQVRNILFPLSNYLCFRGSLVDKISIVFFLVENIRALNVVNNIWLSPIEYFCSFSPPEPKLDWLFSWPECCLIIYLICWWILLVSAEDKEE